MTTQADPIATPAHPPQRVLVIRVGHVGDMVVITPLLRSLLDWNENLRLTLITSGEGRRLLHNFDPRIENIWIYDRRRFPGFVEKNRLARLIASRHFDRVLVLEDNPSFLDLLRRVDYPVHAIASAPVSARHFGDRALSLVADWGVPRQWASLPVDADKQAQVRAELAALGIDDNTLVVGLHPSYSGRNKRFFRNPRSEKHRVWPQDYWAELARQIRRFAEDSNRDIRVIVDLPAKEAALVDEMMRQADGSITLLTPPPDFERYKALLARMDVLITPNSGPMHLAAALGTRVIALFSNWDPGECGPYVDPADYVALRAEDTAQPEQGLTAITAEQVFTALRAQMGS
ncbi:MAG TPA: lipopolysaccharide heptosyltransferase family protein [Gammaproteobacteria bacterium]|nr:lipopolysaccharide heptosyltransferase family protein [Gammaproteobacteria bacterium]